MFIPLFCPLSKTGQCLDPWQGSPFHVKDDHIQLGFYYLDFPKPVVGCSFLSLASAKLPLCLITIFIQRICTKVPGLMHKHTPLPISGYSTMQKSNKVKDESAFFHSTLCSGPWLDTQRRLKRRKLSPWMLGNPHPSRETGIPTWNTQQTSSE